MSAERDLLFGVMAVQLGLVDARAIMGAAAAWAADRSQGIAARLEAAGALSPARCRMLEAMVAEAVRAEDGDATAALEAFGGSRVVEQTFAGSLVLEPDGRVTPATPAGVPAEEDTYRVTREHAGRYKPSSGAPHELGRGGLGKVLLCVDEHIGREVAIKEMLGAGEKGGARTRMSTALARFLREARVTGQLEHPNIVPVYELGRRADGAFYYTMKVVRGRTLARALVEAGALPGRLKLLKHFVDLCQAVAYAHSRGVVHRDLKPANVMVGEFGETVVLDWGLAKARGQTDLRGEELRQAVRDLEAQDSGATVAGSAVGTPAYMSPEQAEGRLEDVDERSDVWGLGAVLYEILTGGPPFQGVTVFEVMGQVLKGQVPDPLLRCPRAPAELASVCRKALQREPGRRYQSARQLAEEVQAYLTGGRVRAYDYRLGELLRRFAGRHKAVLSVAAAGLLLLAALGVYSYRQVVDERNQATRAREEARGRLAETLLEGSQTALDDGDFWAARARLRAALEIEDSLRARGLWHRLQGVPERWSATLDSFPVEVLFSPDGRGIVVATDGGRVLWWDLADRRPRQITSHAASIRGLDFGPDGRELASGSIDGQVQITSLDTGKSRVLLRTGVTEPLRFHPSGASLGRSVAGQGVELVDVTTGERRALFALPENEDATNFVISPDGALLAAGTVAGRVHLFEVATAREIGAPLPGWTGGLAFGPRGAWLAIGCGLEVCLAEPRSGRSLDRLKGPVSNVRALGTSADGHVASTGSDHSICVWRPGAGGMPGGQAKVLHGHRDKIDGLSFSPDGGHLASCSEDLTVRTWDLSRRPRMADRGHTGDVVFAEVSPDGSLLATAALDRSIRVWDLARGTQLRVLTGHTGGVWRVRFAPDGRRLASVGMDRTARLWDPATGAELLTLPTGDPDLIGLVFDPAGRLLATASQRGMARVWDLDQAVPIAAFHLRGAQIQDVALSPDGKKVAVSGTDGAVHLWTIGGGESPLVLRGLRGEVSGVAFTPDGRSILASDRSGSLVRLPVEGGPARVIAQRPVGLAGFRLHSSGERVAVGQMDGQVLTLDLAGGEPRPIPGTRGLPLDLSEDFRWVVSSPGAAEIQVWEVDTGRPLWRTVGLLPDGRLLSHRGCERLPDLAPCPDAERPRWLGASLDAAGADLSPGGRLLCLRTREGVLEVWDARTGARLAERREAGGERLWALDTGCAVLAAGRLSWLTPDGGLTEKATGVRAVGPDPDGLLLQAGQEILLLTAGGQAERVRPHPAGEVSALARLTDGLALGFHGGRIALLGEDGAERGLLSPLPGRVTALAAGPAGSLIAGRDTGWIELWDPRAGRLLEQARIHGAVQHLQVHAGGVRAASEFGDALAWDLGALSAERCALMREVWRDVPVTWDGGQAVAAPPPAGHACAPGGLAGSAGGR